MAAKPVKFFFIFVFAVVAFGFGFLILAKAADEGAPKPPPICGDGNIQSPNSENQYEKCDDGFNREKTETERCTADCGQKLLGWAWADAIGWVSLNNHTCDEAYLDPDYLLPNPAICNPQPQPDGNSKYYLQATAADQVLGWAWSDNAGWICFGQTCLNFCGSSSADPDVPCWDCPSGNCSETPPNNSQVAASLDTADSDKENPPILGWARILSLGNDGWISLNCKNDDVCGAANYQVRLGSNAFGPETSKETRLTLKGWAWNDHAGWLRFNPEIAELKPWLQTKYSDIYARQYLLGETPAPASICNATYRILSNDVITNFCSAQGKDWEKPGSEAISFPAAETLYSNVLGRLDIAGLICEPAGAPPKCFNRYGTMVEGKTADDFAGELTLGNKIYYYAGGDDLALGNITFKNGSGFESGAGTIIVKGNLTINGDIMYESSGLTTSFRNLASVAWIILGDLRILPSVKEIAGNFIVLGKIGAAGCENDIKEPHERKEVPGCGQIYTCSEGDCSLNRLTATGLMMAKKFYFDRTYVKEHETPIQGSEVIIYDGRLLANTPPGLSDFAKALPIWRSGSLVQ